MPDGRIKNFKSYQHFQKHTSLGFFFNSTEQCTNIPKLYSPHSTKHESAIVLILLPDTTVFLSFRLKIGRVVPSSNSGCISWLVSIILKSVFNVIQKQE